MKPRIAAPRRLSLVLCVLLALVPLSACRQQAKPIDAESDGKPTSIISGYYAPGQSLRGGADISRLNLRDIEVVRDGEIAYTHVHGGQRQMGMERSPRREFRWPDPVPAGRGQAGAGDHGAGILGLSGIRKRDQ